MSEDTILLSSRELAKVLGISQLTVRRLVYQRILPYYRLKNRYRFMVSEVLAALGREDSEMNLYAKEKEDNYDDRGSYKTVQHKRSHPNDSQRLSDPVSLEAGELPEYRTERKHGGRKSRS